MLAEASDLNSYSGKALLRLFNPSFNIDLESTTKTTPLIPWFIGVELFVFVFP